MRFVQTFIPRNLNAGSVHAAFKVPDARCGNQPRKGRKKPLPPRWGFHSDAAPHPRLTPWANVLRRSAAQRKAVMNVGKDTSAEDGDAAPPAPGYISAARVSRTTSSMVVRPS